MPGSTLSSEKQRRTAPDTTAVDLAALVAGNSTLPSPYSISLALGTPAAFGDAADFSGMEPQGELSIADVVHKAFVSVDEAGAEAAAATAVIMVTRTMLPPEPVVVKVDRPFLFLTRDIETGPILFMGGWSIRRASSPPP
jgi:serpin B